METGLNKTMMFVVGITALLLFIIISLLTISITTDLTIEKNILNAYDNILGNTSDTSTISQTPTSTVTSTVKNQTWLDFDGVNDNVNQSYSLFSDEGYSINIWVKPILNGTRMRFLQYSNVFSANFGDSESDGQDIVWFFGNGTSLSGGRTTVNFLSNNSWQMITITYDGVNTSKLYKNGILKDTQTYPLNSSGMSRTSTALCLGSSASGFDCQSNVLKGSIDGFYLYNKTLHSEEIMFLYNYTKREIPKNISQVSYKEAINIRNVYCNSTGTCFGYSASGNDFRLSNDKFSSTTLIKSFPSTQSQGLMTFVDSRGTIFTGMRNASYMWMSMGNATNWTQSLNFSCGLDADVRAMAEDNNSNLLVGEYSYGDTTEKCAIAYKSSDGGVSWSVFYNDSSAQCPSNCESRHIHNLIFDTYNNCTYITMGDYVNASKIIKTCDDGASFDMVKNDSNSKMTLAAFTKNYRFFGEDRQGSSELPSNLYRTSDDSTFESILTTTNTGYWWASLVDSRDILYISTVRGITGGEHALLWATKDEGDTFYTLMDYIDDLNFDGFNTLTKDNEDYIFYSNNTYAYHFYAIDTIPQLITNNLNENNGTTAYDSSGNSNDGIINGAIWNNDGVDNTLTNNVDYQVAGTTYTILNSEYDYTWINATYTYNGDIASSSSNIASYFSTGAGNFFSYIPTSMTLFGVIFVLMIVFVLVTVVIKRIVE